MGFTHNGMPFCMKCGDFVDYTAETKLVRNVVRGTSYSFFGIVARCKKCGDEVYVPAVNDINCQASEDAYFEVKAGERQDGE